MCLEIKRFNCWENLRKIFAVLKTGQNLKSNIFQEIGIPSINVQLSEIF